jgi:putative hydrolase of the HAD superfamily
MPIKVISFDLDDTLLDKSSFDDVFWYEEVPRLYAEKYQVTLAKARRDVRAAYAAKDPSDPDWYRPSYWFRHFRLEQDPDDALHRLAKGIRIFPDVIPTLRALKQDGYRLAVLTHTCEEFLRLKLHAIHIDDLYFSHVFSTIDGFNTTKKDPAVYRAMLDRLAIRRSELIHIGDDKAADYDAPRAAGIRAFWLDRTGKHTGEDIVHSLTEFRERLRNPG